MQVTSTSTLPQPPGTLSKKQKHKRGQILYLYLNEPSRSEFKEDKDKKGKIREEGAQIRGTQGEYFRGDTMGQDKRRRRRKSIAMREVLKLESQNRLDKVERIRCGGGYEGMMRNNIDAQLRSRGAGISYE